MTEKLEIIDQYKNTIRDHFGFAPNVIVCDKLTRFGDKKICWYIFHANGRAAGAFGNFKTSEYYNWKAEGNYPKLSDQQRLDLQIEAHRQKLIRQSEESAKHAAAANKAAYIWRNAKPAPESHPYLIRKRIKPHGARLGQDGRLIIPLHNSDRELVNLQFISGSGEKRFLSGGLKKCCFLSLGNDSEIILICEGFATGASLFEDSGYQTIVAFDAGNLLSVAQSINLLYPRSKIIICGDNDESGVGQKAAAEAAKAVKGKFIVPPIPGYDFNDMAVCHG